MERSEALGCAERLERVVLMLFEESLDLLALVGRLRSEAGSPEKLSALAWR